MKPIATFLWIVASLAVIFTTGLTAGWLLQRYDQQSGFEAEARSIVDALGLEPGMTAADVLAGTGKWSIDLARRVPASSIIATEYGTSTVASLQRNVTEAAQAGVTVVASSDGDTGLAERCCDAILVRAAYHDLKAREGFNRSLHRALRPDGRLVIIDFDQGTPEHQSGHGIARTRVVDELTSAGFQLLDVIEDWSGHAYCVVFTSGATDSSRQSR